MMLTALMMNQAPNMMKSKPEPIFMYFSGTRFEIAESEGLEVM